MLDGDRGSRHEPVTEYLRDSPAVARSYCPVCEPDAAPTREILDVHWCIAHAPVWSGADDGVVTAGATPPPSQSRAGRKLALTNPHYSRTQALRRVCPLTLPSPPRRGRGDCSDSLLPRRVSERERVGARVAMHHVNNR